MGLYKIFNRRLNSIGRKFGKTNYILDVYHRIRLTGEVIARLTPYREGAADGKRIC